MGIIGNIDFLTNRPITSIENSIPREVIKFAISKKIEREIDLITKVICDYFSFDKLEFELVSDYEREEP